MISFILVKTSIYGLKDTPTLPFMVFNGRTLRATLISIYGYKSTLRDALISICRQRHFHKCLYGQMSILRSSVRAGMVPALFPDDEKESILNQIRDEALKTGSGPSKDSVWQYFVNKSANNLHIVLGMSPVGDVLRTRCRNFPGTLWGRHFIDLYFTVRDTDTVITKVYTPSIQESETNTIFNTS